MCKIWKIYPVFFCCLFLLSCNQVEKIRISGFVEAPSYYIESQISGSVVAVLKAEGDNVSKDEIFAKIDSKSYEYTIKQQEDIVATKYARLNELVRGARPEEISGAEAKVQQAESFLASSSKALETVEVNYRYAQEKYNDVKKLYEEIKVTEEELRDAKYKLDTQERSLVEAKERVNSSRTGVDSTKAAYDLILSGASSESIDIAKADLNASKNGLLALQSNLEKYQVKVPWSGVLSTKNVNVGEVVNTGSNLANILDLQDLFVKLYIPQKYLPKFNLNQVVNLNPYGDKNQIVKGKISFVSEKAEFTPRNIETDEAKETTVFMIKVKIESREGQVKPGMTLETSFDKY